MIACYLDKILLPKLKTFGVSNDFCNYTIETIERQMLSLIAHWDDIAFRKSVLLIGMEEGLFYEPTAKADIKAFVVVTIRNSPIETMQSDFYAESGLKAPLTNEQIKSITSDSIRFFNSLNFSSLSNSLKNTTLCPDYYYQILNNHPVTKNALEKLSTTSSKSLTYKPVEFTNPYDLEELKGYLNIENKETKTQTVVFDGFSLEIDPMLCQILQRLANQNQGVFIGDSFKFVTRNFEKLIKILEFILTHNICFVTPNYFIANGCVAQRINLLRAAHTDYEAEKKRTQIEGLSHIHKAVFKKFEQKN